MWELLPLTGGGDPYRFLVGVDYVVGRKNCAILVQDDQSISRVHATFSVSHPQSNLSRHTALPVLTVKDASKYGTFVNGEKLQHDSPMVLKSGDQVTCGVYHCKFRVKYEPLITCSSCLDGPEKSALNLAVLKLGGHVVNNWSEECTHLVMNSVKVTIKTICALICMRPIVKPEYFQELVNATQTKLQLPKLESFCPPVDEPSINSEQLDLSARQERRNLFNEKTFLFLNAKQHKKLSPTVTFGGGEAKLFNEGSKDISLLDSPGTCVIDAGNTNSQLSVGPSTKEWIDSTVTMLNSKGLRAIPEAEIGLAVIFMSTDKYCNAQSHRTEESPTFSRAAISGPSLSESMAVEETIMAPPTFNTTAYVPNTEPPQQPDIWLEISGVQEVKETPGIGRRANVNVEDTSTVKESFTASSTGKTPTSSFRNEKKTAVEVKSQQLLTSAESSTAQGDILKHKASQKQSNLMKNYFQAKKRERGDEDDKDMSTAKLAKLLDSSGDEPHSTISSWSKNVQEENQNKRVATGSEPSSLSSETSETSACGNSKRHGDEPISKAVTSELTTLKKRKEFDDFPAGDQELDKAEGGRLDMGDQDQSDTNGIRKKRKLDSVGNSRKADNVSMMADECSSEHVKSGSDMKKELSESTRKPLKNETSVEDSETLPSRLLLTEFRSLVVSNASRKSNFMQREDCINTVNYKKFKKVSYPGAGGFPNIIGGSDLIAHHTKKNSELEVWLRDEIKEQTQQAKEDSMADDLFRYNPKTAKRRR